MHYVLIYTNEADRPAAKTPGPKYGRSRCARCSS